MNIKQTKQATADLFCKAIKERDGKAFNRMVDTNELAPETNIATLLYQLVKEDPTRDTLAFVYSHCWTQNLLHDFAVIEIHSYLTKDDFKPTILDCYKTNTYSIQEAFENTNVNTDGLIPERLESFFELFGTVLEQSAKTNYLDRVKYGFHPKTLEAPLIKWALKYHPKHFEGTDFITLLEALYRHDPKMTFEVVSQSTVHLTTRQRRQMLTKEILQWFDKRDLNNKLNDKYQERQKSTITKI